MYYTAPYDRYDVTSAPSSGKWGYSKKESFDSKTLTLYVFDCWIRGS